MSLAENVASLGWTQSRCWVTWLAVLQFLCLPITLGQPLSTECRALVMVEWGAIQIGISVLEAPPLGFYPGLEY